MANSVRQVRRDRDLEKAHRVCHQGNLVFPLWIVLLGSCEPFMKALVRDNKDSISIRGYQQPEYRKTRVHKVAYPSVCNCLSLAGTLDESHLQSRSSSGNLWPVFVSISVWSRSSKAIFPLAWLVPKVPNRQEPPNRVDHSIGGSWI